MGVFGRILKIARMGYCDGLKAAICLFCPKDYGVLCLGRDQTPWLAFERWEEALFRPLGRANTVKPGSCDGKRGVEGIHRNTFGLARIYRRKKKAEGWAIILP